MVYNLQMVHADCFAEDEVVILVQKIGVGGSISAVGGVAVGFVNLVLREVSLVCLHELFSKSSVFVLVLAFVQDASVGACFCVAVSAREGGVSHAAINLTNEFWIEVGSILSGLDLCAL